MSKLYLVTYKVAAPAVEDELKKAEYWWHDIDNTWIIQTNDSTASEVWKRLSSVHDFAQGERMLIVSVAKNASRFGWLPTAAWEWLNARQADPAVE